MTSSPIWRASPTAPSRPSAGRRSRPAWPRRRSCRASSSARASPWKRCAARPAPARLRADVDRRREARAGRRGRPRVTLRQSVAGVAAAAAVVLALILVLPSGFSGAPSVADAAALAEKPPTQPAPGGVPGAPALLRTEVDDVPFPNYAAKFGWRPAGAREDDPSGREATTVHYQKGARTIQYTIVSGDALDPPSDARTTTRAGVEYRSFRHDGRTVVTWERDGHTCVLSAKAVRPAELLALADWRGKGSIPF